MKTRERTLNVNELENGNCCITQQVCPHPGEGCD